MKTKNKKKENRLKKKAKAYTRGIIDNNDFPHCRKCIYSVLYTDKVGEFEFFTDGCIKDKKGVERIFCMESLKTELEPTNESLKNYVLSYIYQDEMEGEQL